MYPFALKSLPVPLWNDLKLTKIFLPAQDTGRIFKNDPMMAFGDSQLTCTNDSVQFHSGELVELNAHCGHLHQIPVDSFLSTGIKCK